MLKNFNQLIGPKFKQHLAFVYTHWGTGKNDLKKRKKMKTPNEEEKTKEINDSLIQLGVLDENDRKIRCFFIDNTQIRQLDESDLDDDESDLDDDEIAQQNHYNGTINDI